MPLDRPGQPVTDLVDGFRGTELIQADAVHAMDATIEATSGGTGMTLALALNYGSRAEIVRSTAAIALGLALDPENGARLAETGAELDWTTVTPTVFELLQIQ